MNTINMLSKADMVKGHGVLSAHDEQVQLIKEMLPNFYTVYENSWKTCDILHFHTINPSFYIRLLFKNRKSISVGYVHFIPETVENSIHIPRLFKKIFYRYIIHFYKKMDYLVTVNPIFIKKLMSYGIEESKISYIPNFVSEKEFYKQPAKMRQDLRLQYNIRKDAFVVLCVGQLQTRKGVFDFVKIAKQMPDVQFVWAGNFTFGHISDGYKEIKKLLDTPPSNVSFLGYIEREKMIGLYNLSDVMFLPSYGELFPMTILEAMCCETPILVRKLELYDSILFDFALQKTTNDEFIMTLRKMQDERSYYEEVVDMSRKGKNFYSKEHVSQLWNTFYHTISLKKK